MCLLDVRVLFHLLSTVLIQIWLASFSGESWQSIPYEMPVYFCPVFTPFLQASPSNQSLRMSIRPAMHLWVWVFILFSVLFSQFKAACLLFSSPVLCQNCIIQGRTKSLMLFLMLTLTGKLHLDWLLWITLVNIQPACISQDECLQKCSGGCCFMCKRKCCISIFQNVMIYLPLKRTVQISQLLENIGSCLWTFCKSFWL